MVVGWELEIYSIFVSIQAISIFIQSAEFLWVWSRFSATDRLKLTNLIINPNKKLQCNSIACLLLFAIATYFCDHSTFHIYVFVHQHFFCHRIYVGNENSWKSTVFWQCQIGALLFYSVQICEGGKRVNFIINKYSNKW